jgi:hypothetical protein
VLLDANLALGRTAAAEEICRQGSEKPGGLIADDCGLRVAYARDDRRRGAELLNGFGRGQNIKTNWFLNLVLATTWAGAESVLERCPADAVPEAIGEGLRLLARDQPQEAAQRLGAVEYVFDLPVTGLRALPSTMLWFRYGLASALEREGKVEEAIAAIEPFTRPSMAHLSDAWQWPQTRAKVAELYRKAGRASDAARVEEGLRRYLSEADPDYPLRAVLRGEQAAAR